MKMFGKKNDDRAANADNSAENSGDNINFTENGNNKEQNKKHKGRGWLIAGIVIVAIIGCIIAYWFLTTRAPEVDMSDPDVQEGEQVEVAGSEYRKDGQYTILVVGDDQEGFNTDTIMIMNYDSINNTANVVSIPRDTMINNDDKIARKINSVYHSENGGIDSLMDVAEDITGFRPDNYIVVDTNCFTDVINAMGGVYFDVPQDMDYEDQSDHDNDGIFEYEFIIHVKKGYQLLEGYDALGVFRFRDGYAMGDIQRLGVQHDLLMTAAEQFMSSNILQLYNVARIIVANSDTDLTYGNLQWYAQKFLGMSIDDISIFTMPATGVLVNDVAYVSINVDEWLEMLNSNINPLKDDITKEDCPILYWTNPTAPGADGQYHVDPNDLATTDGSNVYNDFPWSEDLLQAEKDLYTKD